MKKQNPTQNEAVKEIKDLIKKRQEDASVLLDSMPEFPKNEGQRALMRMHGTPKEFAKGCIKAIGTISPGEAQAAILKYREEWNKA